MPLAAIKRCRAEAGGSRRAGWSQRTISETPSTPGFAVLALGKLGGGELNFSSDVDLVYVYGSDSEPVALARALSLALPEFYRRLARDLTAALSDRTGEGQLYRVDLRLRPDGRFGALVHSLASIQPYYDLRAASWELSLIHI